MAQIEIKVPDIGDFKEVAIIELLVKPGDTVKAEQSLVTVESDKASMEIPSSHAGVVQALRVALGDKVSEGSVLLVLQTADDAVAMAAPPPETAVAPAPSPEPALVVSTPDAIHASTHKPPTAALPPHEPTATHAAAGPKGGSRRMTCSASSRR